MLPNKPPQRTAEVAAAGAVPLGNTNQRENIWRFLLFGWP
jgi:hypothetical protein